MRNLKFLVIRPSESQSINLSSRTNQLKKSLDSSFKMKFFIPQKNRKWNANLKSRENQVIHLMPLSKVVNLHKTYLTSGFSNMKT